VEGADGIGLWFLSDAAGFLTDELPAVSRAERPIEPTQVDLDEVFRVSGKRALTVAVAGGLTSGRRPVAGSHTARPDIAGSYAEPCDRCWCLESEDDV